MGAEPNFIRFRFCSWKTAKWKGNADSSKVKGPSNAFARLRAHIVEEHYDRFEEMTIDEEWAEETLATPQEH